MWATYSEVRIQAHIERAARLVVGCRACAVHIGAGGGITHGLGITRTELAFVEDVINTRRDADIFGRGVGAAHADH